MTPRIFIFCSLLFITNASPSMKFIKKIKTKKNHKQTFDKCPQEFLFTQKMITNKMLDTDVIRQIRTYNLLLRQKDFQYYLEKWQNHNIPIKYLYLLSPQQKRVLIMVLTHSSTLAFHKENYQYYTFKSKNNYKNFLTLPIELKKHLTTEATPIIYVGFSDK